MSSVGQRSGALFEEHKRTVFRHTDRMFAALMVVQWVAAIILSLTVSPKTWEGGASSVHVHVYAAVLLGGALSGLPVALALLRPGDAITRYVIACAQMFWSGLLIHLSGGRIETHFHIFGSLAFLGFYRDWKLLVPATLIVAADHLLRQLFFPESVYGVANPETWRFLEHAFWVVFIDIFLFASCRQGIAEMKAMSDRTALAEALGTSEQAKSKALDAALSDLRTTQERTVRAEKLAAIGQLAASIGHELRNPLAAIGNAHQYVMKKLGSGETTKTDPRIGQFLGVIDRELQASNKIISDLLDFARERPPVRQPCPLRPLIDEAVALLPKQANVEIINLVPETMAIPLLDKQQIRQVVMNLVQNGMEAIPAERAGTVELTASGGGASPFQLRIKDSGDGIQPEALENLFQPLFTTKTRGTGLGLAICQSIVHRHGGHISAESPPGHGSTFTLQFPPSDLPPQIQAA